jgi:hypothetical protein
MLPFKAKKVTMTRSSCVHLLTLNRLIRFLTGKRLAKDTHEKLLSKSQYCESSIKAQRKEWAVIIPFLNFLWLLYLLQGKESDNDVLGSIIISFKILKFVPPFSNFQIISFSNSSCIFKFSNYLIFKLIFNFKLNKKAPRHRGAFLTDTAKCFY